MIFATIQKIIDDGVPKMRAQGEPSVFKPSKLETICLYRSETGKRCLIGQCIADEFYTRNLEGESAASSAVLRALESSGYAIDLEHLWAFGDQLYELQRTHDLAARGCENSEDFMRRFEERLKAFSTDYGYVIPPVEVDHVQA